ncbi:MAG: hypothetical protein ACXVBH_09260 [Flavisolibacter sp.]
MDEKSMLYISKQPSERQKVLTAIHNAVLQQDKTVTPVVEPMMGKEMIIYKAKGMMKYALSSVKNHMSLHVLPMYGSQAIYSKYQKLLPQAAFQKGCINFNSPEQMPINMVEDLVKDCSKIDLVKMREDYLEGKKKAKKAKS